MLSFGIALDETRSSVVSTDFYIPANVSANETVTENILSGFDWVFWGIGLLIVILVVGFAYWAFKRRRKAVVPVKSVKPVKTKTSNKKKAKKSSKRKK